jgi:hypothetical protein
MRRDVERRLRYVEVAAAGSDTIEIWVDEGGGIVSDPQGERITLEAFDHLRAGGRPSASAVVVLCYPEDLQL